MKHIARVNRMGAVLGVLLAGMLPSGAQIPETGEKIQCIVPIRAITSGKAHWFGYYDKEQFDPSDRYVLAMEVGFEDRSPTVDDAIVIGMVDTAEGDTWIPLGESTAWGWQQGCMLQWIPGSDSEIIYNTIEGDRHVAVILDVFTREKRVLPRPIYTLSPDGKRALSVNFTRIQDTRPGYGYAGGVDPVADQLAPEGDGIWSVDLASGESTLLFSYADIAAIPQEKAPSGKHWFNHLLYNTDGSRFIFLHRAHNELDVKNRWTTRMFTADSGGGGLHIVADHGMVSHFIWRDPAHILAWSREPDTGDAYYLYRDQSEEKEIVGAEVFTRDGHCTYSPDRKWMLTDTYPDKNNLHHLYLYNLEDKRFIELAQIYRPKPSDNEWRCDLHPGWSRDGRTVAIDAMYLDGKRQVHLLDVSEYTDPEGSR
ncbi:MAG: hypothetical protein KF886_18185 [Candidatus Hydrogenedentes bacterium]|nr:hypothetical protein [Candidatus Hydrogenedentota bacterium]